MKKITGLLILLVFSVHCIYGQQVNIMIDSLYTQPNETIVLNVKVDSSFNPIRGAQFSIGWEPGVLRYINHTAMTQGLLDNAANTGEGRLGFVWNLQPGSENNFVDTTTIFELEFEVIGALGDSTMIEVTDAPVAAIFFGCCTEDANDPLFPLRRVDYLATPGYVKIVDALAIESISPAIECSGQLLSELSPRIVGGVPPYEYLWQGPNQFTSTNSQLENIEAGVYSLRLRDQAGQVIEDSFVVQAPEPLTLNLDVKPSLCGSPTGSIQIDVSGGTPSYRFLLNDEGIDLNTIEDLEAGQYQVKVVDGNECETDTLITLNEINNLEVEILAANTEICQGDTTVLRATGPTSSLVSWFKDGNLVSTNVEQLTISEGGLYSMLTSDSVGCEGMDTILIVETPAPPSTLFEQDVLRACAGEELLLEPSISGDFNFTWNNGASSPSILVGEAGVYLLSVSTNESGCISTDSIQVVYNDIPSFNLPETIEICDGESVQIGIESEPGVDYLWSTGETTSLIFVNESGQYALSASNLAQCEQMDSVEVLISDQLQPSLFVMQDEQCENKNIELIAGGGSSYTWMDTTGTLQILDELGSLASISIQEDTEIEVIISNACAADTLREVIPAMSSLAGTGPDTCIAMGTSIELRATGGSNYFWLDNEFPVDNPALANPTANPERATTYIVEITTSNGCVKTDSIYVAVADDPVRFVDAINVITPNGDGLNDYLEFANIEKYNYVKLQVFNRWGNLVYEKLNYQSDPERWDGQFIGKTLPDGVYYYLLYLNEDVIKQTITLLK